MDGINLPDGRHSQGKIRLIGHITNLSQNGPERTDTAALPRSSPGRISLINISLSNLDEVSQVPKRLIQIRIFIEAEFDLGMRMY